jgi:hypothetical protein
MMLHSPHLQKCAVVEERTVEDRGKSLLKTCSKEAMFSQKTHNKPFHKLNLNKNKNIIYIHNK